MASYSYDNFNVEDTTDKIDFKTNIEFSDMKFNNCLMYLEPRLQEYIKKREYFRKNRIQPSISLEQEYSICKSDIEKINNLLRCSGSKNCGITKADAKLQSRIRQKCGYVQLTKFNNENNGRFNVVNTCVNRDPTKEPKKFPVSNTPLQDFVLPTDWPEEMTKCKIVKPRAKVKEGFTGNFDREHMVGIQDRQIKTSDFRPAKEGTSCPTAMRTPMYNNNDVDYWNKVYSEHWNKDPENDWKQVSEMKPMKYRLAATYSGKTDGMFPTDQHLYQPGVFVEGRNFNQKNVDIDSELLRPSYVDQDTSGVSRPSYMDKCYKVVIPGGRNNSCYTDEYLNHSYYFSVPFMGASSGSNEDTDLETSMKHSEATRNSKQKKTAGAPVDRFFDLDRPIQDEGHIILPFPRGGVDARAIDKWTKKDAQYVI
jgi:hypothetical protein